MKSKLTDLPLLMVAAMLLACATESVSVSAAQYSIHPPPSWVQMIETRQSASPDSGGGSVYLLLDNQVKVSGAGVERYHRAARKAVSTSGLEDVSQIEIDFEPSYQELVIHHIRIHRGDQIIDALRPREIKIIQKEDNLDERIYNGTLSALVILSDVRVGDLIDYAYTTKGDNPILAGRYVDSYYLAVSERIEKIRLRVLWPSARSLHIKNKNIDIQPAVRDLGGEMEYVWERDNVSAVEKDDSSPQLFDPAPSITLSEFGSWEEVARWALPLYKLDSQLVPDLQKQIEKWRNLPSTEERLLAALQFAQDDIRYMGIELGPGSHLPTRPSVVFQRRFGDCKDKTLLLCSALNSLGIEATPALVNTEVRQKLDEWQPSPYAFNHVIARVSLDGKTFWLDPTISLQRGSLDRRYNPDYRRALVVREDVNYLEEIPLSPVEQPETEVREVYTVAADKSASLEVTTTYRASEADSTRYHLSSMSLAEYGKSCLFRYLYLTGGLSTQSDTQAEGLPQVSDDQQTNTIIVKERYRISSFWNEGRREVFANYVGNELSRPVITGKSEPIDISYPVNVSQTIEIHLPQGLSIPKATDSISSDAIRFRYRRESAGKTIRFEYQFQTLRDQIAAQQVSRYLRDIDRVEKALSFVVWESGEPAEEGSGGSVLIVLAVLFGPALVFGTIKVARSFRERKRFGEFRRKMEVAEGHTPETAIHLQREVDLHAHLSGFRCSCGSAYYNQGDTIEREGCIFDGRRLIIVGLRCGSCGSHRNFYFAPADA